MSALKIEPQHLADMRQCIERVMQRDTWPQVIAEYRARGLSGMRLRWDTLHASQYPTTPLYRYLNDMHIDSALQAIMPDTLDMPL